MRKFWLFLINILLVSCSVNNHVTVEYLDTQANNIISRLERDINANPEWNVSIDSIKFYIKEYNNNGNTFIGEVYGKAYDWYDFCSLDYHDDTFISHFEIWEEPIGKYKFNYEDVVYYLESTGEIKRFKW